MEMTLRKKFDFFSLILLIIIIGVLIFSFKCSKEMLFNKGDRNSFIKLSELQTAESINKIANMFPNSKEDNAIIVLARELEFSISPIDDESRKIYYSWINSNRYIIKGLSVNEERFKEKVKATIEAYNKTPGIEYKVELKKFEYSKLPFSKIDFRIEKI